MAIEVVRSEFLSPQASESIPSIVGEIASPSAWITKMFTAKAMARISGGVTFTITVLSGPVFKKRKNSAKKIAMRQPAREFVARA